MNIYSSYSSTCSSNKIKIIFGVKNKTEECFIDQEVCLKIINSWSTKHIFYKHKSFLQKCFLLNYQQNVFECRSNNGVLQSFICLLLYYKVIYHKSRRFNSCMYCMYVCMYILSSYRVYEGWINTINCVIQALYKSERYVKVQSKDYSVLGQPVL